jgi:hypothetical protein
VLLLSLLPLLRLKLARLGQILLSRAIFGLLLLQLGLFVSGVDLGKE